MCGINAVIYTSIEANKKIPYMELANRLLQHRGPDHSSHTTYQENKVILGHTRLSIIDLHEHANQPLHSFDNKYSIIYNGEIYNYLELKKKCEEKGSKFQTNSDTEVIIECYRHWGSKIFKDFIGMWAIILLDIERNILIVSRDPFGIKPLYYTKDNNCFYFSSEIAPLKNSHKDASIIDEVTEKLFLEAGILQRGCWTFFKNIKKFPHGHYQEIDLNIPANEIKINPSLYWDLKDYENSLDPNLFLTNLKHSTLLHTRADVPIASTLSGGLDSSAITLIAKKKIKKTFTSSFPAIKSLDETAKAKFIAKQVNAEHIFTEPTLEKLEEDLIDLIKCQEEPFGTLSIYIQYKIFKKINEHKFKVSLDGQGADEILGGYKFISNYLLATYKRQLPFSFIKELFFVSKKNKKDPNFKLDRNIIFKSKGEDNIKSMNDLITIETDGNYNQRLKALSKNISTHKDMLLYLTFEGNLQQLLHYVDRNSMNFSIESRVPFLSLELALNAINLPVEKLLKNGTTKFLLRESFKEQLHPDTYNEKVKLGFPAPDQEWVKKLTNNFSDHKNFRSYILQKWREVNTPTPS